MLKPTSFQVSEDLFLVCHPLSAAAAPPPKAAPTHHLAVIDCSGSMYESLPKIRKQLKAKWPTLTAEGDTFSLLWFSGRGECGILIEAIEPGLKTQAGIDRAIDKLQSVGLTGFKEPLGLTKEVVGRLIKTYGASPKVNFFFMSDGCDNVWPRAEVLRVATDLGAVVSSSTFVSYGWYADQPFLLKLAEQMGGCVILAQDFAEFEPTFEKALRKSPSAKKQGVVVEGSPIGEFVFALDGEELPAFAVDRSGTVAPRWGTTVPSHLTEVWYLSTDSVGKVEKLSAFASVVGPAKGTSAEQAAGRTVRGVDAKAIPAAYAAASVYAERIQPKLVWKILRELGDVRLIEEFSICVGKQKYAAFTATTRAAAFGQGQFVKGYDPDRAPREDAFTLLDLFGILSGDERCRILTESDAFIYSRIGRKSVSKALMLGVKEGDEVARLAEELKALAPDRSVPALAEVLDKLDAIVRDRVKPLPFHIDDAAAERGYRILDLVWNKTFPNLSFRVWKPGYVLPRDAADLPADMAERLPARIDTYQFRTYAVVKDGLVHLDALPVVVPREVLDVLRSVGAVDANDPVIEVDGGFRVVVDLKKLPVVNQRMLRDASARELAELTWRTLELSAAAKVWKSYAPEKESVGFKKVYGDAAAEWLEKHAVTDHSGWRPESTTDKPVDKYLAKAFEVKIPGFSSSLPSVEDARERMENEDKIAKDPSLAKGKTKLKGHTGTSRLLEPALREVDFFRQSTLFKGAANPEALFVQWVSDKAKAAVAETRKLQVEIAKCKFVVLIGNSWLREFSSFEETTLDVVLGGEKRTVTFALDEAREIDV